MVGAIEVTGRLPACMRFGAGSPARGATCVSHSRPTGKLQLEMGSSAATQSGALAAKGHVLDIVPMTSGLGFLMRRGEGWLGAADPRRDGVALGW